MMMLNLHWTLIKNHLIKLNQIAVSNKMINLNNKIHPLIVNKPNKTKESII